jgi:cytidylate kinase
MPKLIFLHPLLEVKLMNNIIAIDGLAGSGKGTLANRLKDYLNYDILDTGSIYRMVTFLLLEAGYDETNISKAIEIAKNLGTHQDLHLLANDIRLRTPEVDRHVSAVAQIQAVRQALLVFQIDFAHNYEKRGKLGAILDGRDIGTHIAPDASIKLYITASAEARATRRFKQNKDKGLPANYSEILEQILVRDKGDAKNSVPATDAFIIDSSNTTADEVFAIALKYTDEQRKKG